MKKGLFITFEGGEGAGKTTLIESIFQKLLCLKFDVIKTREPGGSKLSEQIRSLLLEPRSEKVSSLAELALFLASRAQHVEELILPSLQAGKIVLCDRFNDSSIAYQGIARSLGKANVSSVCQFFSSNLTPSLTFYLDIDPLIGLTRVKKAREQDRIEQEGLLFHQKIRNAYLELIQDHPDRMRRIDASQSKELVFQDVFSMIEPLING